MLASTLVLTFTVEEPVTTPPGPVDRKSWVVGAFGDTPCVPLGCTAPTLLMFVSTVSVVCHVRLEVSPQLICPVEAEKLPVTGATAIVALAIPALNRGKSFSLVPRDHSLVFCVFFD